MRESLTTHKKRPVDAVLYFLIYLCALLAVVLLALILVYVCSTGVLAA